MSSLTDKKAAKKMRDELKRTNPDAYAELVKATVDEKAKIKRFVVEYKTPEGEWIILDSTDIQGEAIQFVCQCRWDYPKSPTSWKVIDTSWILVNRKSSIVIKVICNRNLNSSNDMIPYAPIFPLVNGHPFED